MGKEVVIPHRPRGPEIVERDGRTLDWVAEEGGLPSVSQALDAVQHGTALAAASSGELAAALRKNRLIVELQALDELETRTQYEKGRRFSELKDLCDHGEFLKVLSDQLQGVSLRSAQEYMRFYKMCEQVPALAGSFEKNYTKAVTLRNALKEEGFTIEALNGPDFQVITPEAIDTMSAAQLKKEIKRLTRDVGEVVKEETKALVQERDQLIKERDEAIAQNDPPSWKTTKERALEVAKIAEKLGAQVAAMLDGMPRSEVPTDLLFGIDAALFRAQTAAQTAWERFSRLKDPEDQVRQMDRI